MVKKSPAVRRHFQLVSVITAAFDGALIVAMYLPIFELGAVV
jgi:type II secretory pathway component PulF